MRPVVGRRILLGVTGGIASYKAVSLARLLAQAGAEVDVVLSRAAREFVGAITFEAVTGRPVLGGLLDEGQALAHIRLAKAADLVVIAPATADLLARAAHGRADDLLTAVLLATRAPVLVCPAMNDGMWAHPQVRANAERLQSFGYAVLEPAIGPLAFGEGVGPGRLPEPEAIVAHCARLLQGTTPLSGRHVVVTAGPTREPVDPVRFLSNHSSGRMGAAIAAAAWRRGARVTLVHGPLAVPLPIGPAAIAVETTREMHDAVAAALADADVLVMAAAPADFAPATVAASKLKKGGEAPLLPLAHTPDILVGTRAARPAGLVAVGFALETEALEANAAEKLARKGLDLIVANDATDPDAGFGIDTNRVVILDAHGGRDALPVLTKDEVAEHLLDRISGVIGGRQG